MTSPTYDNNSNGYYNNGDNDNNNPSASISTISDIPLDSAEFGASLPTSEEIRHSSAIAAATTVSSFRQDGSSTAVTENGTDADDDDIAAAAYADNDNINTSCWNRFKHSWCSGILLLCGIAIVLGVGLGIGFQNKRERSMDDSSSTTARRRVDMGSLTTYLRDTYSISFARETTPQYLAAKWMAQEDPFNWPLPGDNDNDLDTTDVYEYRFLMRYTMALFFFHNNGVNWGSSLNFLSNKDACLWNSQFWQKGVACNPQSAVIEQMIFPANQLTGTLPTELGLLTTMKIIDVGFNNLQGTIPTELTSWTNLLTFILDYNQFHGKLPANVLNQWNQLYSFSISNNDFQGPLPAVDVFSDTLTLLYLDDNDFTGDPTPVFNSLTNLERLIVHGNSFSSTLNDNFLNNHNKLQILDLSHNDFELDGVGEGTIPKHFFQHDSLRILDLSENRLLGTLPSEGFDEENDDINNNSSSTGGLEMLSLYGNNLFGKIPSELLSSRLSSSLFHLDLSFNLFTGDIPMELGAMEHMRYLFLSENAFDEGPIPDFLWSLDQLEDLSLRNTARVGPLPDFNNTIATNNTNNNTTSSSSSLSLLDLSNNEGLYGTIPESWGQQVLTNLHFLLLNQNPLINGTVPIHIKNMTRLQAAFFDGTDIEGDLNDIICALPQFQDEIVLNESQKLNEAFADCNGNNAKVTCDCCHCCDPDAVDGCSNPSVNQLDLQWENGFRRKFYQLNDTLYIDYNNY